MRRRKSSAASTGSNTPAACWEARAGAGAANIYSSPPALHAKHRACKSDSVPIRAPSRRKTGGNHRTRVLAWSSLALMNFGIMLLLDIAQVSIAMLLFHLFVFDTRWIRGKSTAPRSQT